MSMDNNPFRSLERQFEQLQRQFEDTLKMWGGEQFGIPKADITLSRMGVDLADRGDEFVLTADVPGFESEEIDLRLSEQTVHITAERDREEREESDELYLRSERDRQTLRRSVRLPEPVDAETAEATYRNGVLTVVLPKAEPTDVNGTKIDVTG